MKLIVSFHFDNYLKNLFIYFLDVSKTEESWEEEG